MGDAMAPYFHFAPGDTLWFEGWMPSSASAVFGTSIGLFLLALVDRWIAACRAVAEVHWNKRAQISLSNEINTSIGTPDPPLFPNYFMSRIVLEHDVPRGLLQAAQSALGLAFMLAIMTFQASFLLAILLGLGVGEMIFGRFTIGAASHM